jgi:hypothetical protein
MAGKTKESCDCKSCKEDIVGLKEKVNVLFSVISELIHHTGTGNKLLAKHGIEPYVLTKEDRNQGKWKKK